MVKVRFIVQTTTLQLNLTQSFNAIIMLHNYTQIVIAFNTKYSKAFFKFYWSVQIKKIKLY